MTETYIRPRFTAEDAIAFRDVLQRVVVYNEIYPAKSFLLKEELITLRRFTDKLTLLIEQQKVRDKVRELQQD